VNIPWHIRIAMAAAIAAALAACESLESAIRKPTVEVVGFAIERLTFEDAAVRLDLKITNPNPVGIELAGFDYSLVIEGSELVKGTVDKKVGLRANGSSVVPVPMSFRYDSLFAAVRGLADKDETPYQITVGLSFDIPVLGKMKVTAAHKGTLPVVHVPRVRLASVRLEGVTLQGASIVLGVELANPNGFGLSLASLDYRFSVSGQRWATGTSRRAVQVPAKQSGRIDIPVNLDFASIGRSVRDTLLGRAPLAYSLSGTLAVGTTLPLLRSATVPVEVSGQVGLTR
jgi:LEA14-like dessication related protein